MREEVPDHETETYEHIPWSQLTIATNKTDRGKWMYLAAGLLVVAAIAAVMARIVWKPGTAIAAPTTSRAPVVAPVEATVTTAASVLYSEADLMAALPPVRVDHAVAAAARRYLREWVAAGDDSWAYVEWDVVESIDDLGDGLFRVLIRMQLLHTTGTETVRLPEEGVEVLVRFAGGEVSIADLPSPIVHAALPVAVPLVEPTQIPPVVAAAALEGVAPWGTGAIVSGGRMGGRWRIELLVESSGGLSREAVIWLTSDGERTTPER
jgi:hypothetical protein